MDVYEIIRAARAAAPDLPESSVLQHVVFLPPTSAQDNHDRNEHRRERVSIALNQALVPADHAFARYLLTQEMALHRASTNALLDTLKRCAYMLYRLRHVEDAALLWAAKNVNFDAYAGLDIQLLIGAGFDATIDYLNTHPSGAQAIEYLEACQSAGDFDNMEAYNRFIEGYFRDE